MIPATLWVLFYLERRAYAAQRQDDDAAAGAAAQLARENISAGSATEKRR